MGHGCRICGRVKPNEAFSGKGHKTHICKVCHTRPKAERERIDIEAEIRGFIEQSRISPQNRTRLKSLEEHADPELRELAAVVGQVSLIAEHGRKRWKRVHEKDEALFRRCQKLWLLPEDDDRYQEFGLDHHYEFGDNTDTDTGAQDVPF